MDYLVISENRTFLISGHNGNVDPADASYGLYYNDTRHLSEMRLLLNGEAPDLLSYNDQDVYRAGILLANQAYVAASGEEVRDHSLGIRRERVMGDSLFEVITITNYNRNTVEFDLDLELASDFADIFLVRGFPPAARGTLDEPTYDAEKLVLAYHGMDSVTRSTTVRWSRPPEQIETARLDDAGRAASAQMPEPIRARLHWHVSVPANGEHTLELSFTPGTGENPAEIGDRTFRTESQRLRRSYAEWTAQATVITTDNTAFNTLLVRSSLDLRALTGSYPTGRLPHAGIPWFAVPFGRDSLIASLQTLCLQPDLAAGTLRFMAAYQGTKDDAWRDEHPGKIMHELRFGEFAGMGAVPHTPYYGTIDATLLFLMLFSETMRWTGDQALYHALLPAVERALDWIDAYGDIDGDGYVDFQPRSGGGLSIQGWKDSQDSVQYPDGRLGEPPIALVEVQAYAYAAKTAVAATLRQMGGDTERADRLEASAAALREQFNRDFWLPDLGFYAQVLDGHKQALPELTSNVGHALLGGILTPERARQVAERLLRPDMSSGWGIRTRASSDIAYNPMSYHNGSVWPHDNSLIIWGMQRSGLRDAANAISGQIFAAAHYYPRMRLPELMCGFGREDGASEGPAEYPVSCSPQAWAAGTPYLILQSILGLEPDAAGNVLTVTPHLPAWLGRIDVQNLRVGSGRVSFVASKDGLEIISSEGIEIRHA